MWRRLQYGGGFAAFWLFAFLVVYVVYFYDPADCFDGVQNGAETGVDCGGPCVRICAAEVDPPRIVWADSFEIIPGQYNAVAYVENRNRVAATQQLTYRLELFNDTGEIIAERSGATILPPNGVYPIFEGRIETTNDQVPAETRLTIGEPELWQPATVGRDQFQTRDIELVGAGERPRLSVILENLELRPAENVEVVATIFNEAGEPLTASQTFIDELPGRDSSEVVFTWPNPIAMTVKSCVVPTDVVVAIDLSGSMNNDGGSPPQPLASARTSAAGFVENLQAQDQVAVVTFASDAAVRNRLTPMLESAASTILNLTIDPAEERGFTNTAAALREARAELTSSRVNPDARRVLVLLTDGLPTAPEGVEDFENQVLTEASRLADANIEVYAIGLGSELDRSLIEGLASDPQNAYIAPDRGDLQAIYNEVSTSLCEVGPTNIDVLPKTNTNFAPLR